MNKVILAMILSTFACIGALMGAPYANAISDYDNVVYSVDKVNLPVYDNQLGTYEYEDITTTWYDYFSNNLTAKNDFDTARDSGGHWAVITNANEVNVFWSTDVNVKTEFFFAYGMPSFGIQNGNTWSSYKFSKVKQTGDISSSYYGNQTSVNTFYNGDKPNPVPTEFGLVFSNYDVIYPVDYQGQTIPDSPPNPDISVDYVPNWYITNAVDYKAQFHDTNFNTFDGNPFYCEDDLAPVLYWEIWRVNISGSDDVKLDEGYQSATAPISFNAEKAEIERDFKIIGWYSCGENSSYNFTENAQLVFTMDAHGNQKFDLMTGCVLETFPYIDIPQCYDNLSSILNMLATGELKFPHWSFNANCTTLEVMDDWLNLPDNYEVCPKIPNNVREIVTPFIAFMLGIVTLGFIQRRRGDL